MTGGTLGVPRTLTQIANHPLSCYLFGGGKGDQRSHFDQYTNAGNVVVDVSGGIIYGSVFGGSEDGHVLGNASVTIRKGDSYTIGSTLYTDGPIIGTWGTSYVDGNIFGGGRGFSGENLKAGTIGGNVDVNISGGTMLGSVYGGGRLASVGVDFSKSQSADSGQFTEDSGGKTYGYVTINISGGTIGNTTETVTTNGHTTGGNVFGGSMGRLTLLNGSPNPLWSKLAQVKTSSVNITGGTIKSNVYGGAEYGTTRDRVYVTVGGTRADNGTITPESTNTPTINGHVFGGGYGSTIDAPAYNSAIVSGVAPNTTTYLFTPMQYAGIVGGETVVNIVGKGNVKGNVYGGGEMASVGVIDYEVEENSDGELTYNTKNYSYKKAIKHASHSTDDKDVRYGFGLSWPYEFDYVATLKDGSSYIKGGKTTVNITGSAKVEQYVYGGGKGRVWFGATQATEEDITEQRYREAHIANVRETHVTIGTDGGDASSLTPEIGPGTATTAASVYGGGEDGHVLGDANVIIHHGKIGHSVFGGGKGLDTYKTTLWKATGTDTAPEHENLTNQDVYSWTAGRVYGNTNVTMKGGKVGWFVYGGGNLGSVGKGSYTGGSDDYSKGGYGELPSTTDAIWTTNPAAGTYAYYFQNSGIATVNILGGTVGEEVAGYRDDGVPYGSVFGGCRGKAAASCKRSPRYRYVPDFFLGYTNKCIVNIGGTSSSELAAGDGPTIYGSLYGGGQDGHVRNSTEVHIYKGNIAGRESSIDTSERTGNVFGAGSGLGTFDATDSSNNSIKVINNSSGSVTCTASVEVNGGTVARNVYGGGAIASVGPSKTGPGDDEQKAASSDHASYSYTRVDINGGRVNGCVFGASRGPGEGYLATNPKFDTEGYTYDPSKYATNIWSYLYVTGGTIDDNAYGGGEGGIVKQDTEVHLTGGTITNDAYGGGKGTQSIAADVNGNTTLELNKEVAKTAKGCIVKRVFGCNDLHGTPKGHALVHVYATQHPNTTVNPHIENKYTKFKSMEGGYTTSNYTDNTNDDDLKKLAKAVGFTDSEITTFENAISGASGDDAKKVALNNYIEAIADKKYDVLGVYGGGDLAIYEPTDPDENTEVIIEGCDVTSIKQVYGGGNAASTPANLVNINAAYEIHEVFGGGNGKDSYEKYGKWYKNPGANVGYYATYHHDTSGSATGDTQGDAYPAVVNDGTGGYLDAREPDDRRANYPYGKGTATLNVTGGRVHTTYGGSNTRGNVRAEVVTNTENAGDCALLIDKSYPAGKNADTDASSKLSARCVDYQEAIYGGAEGANVYSDVVIDITNGTYGAIYGGNDRRGKIYGSITINVHEEGCKPIIIGELYGGGKQADYSIYGFNADNSARTKAEYDALSAAEKAKITVQEDPRINIISATKIGKIYGGGYQAKMIGSPTINVNMEEGYVAAKYVTESPSDFTAGDHHVIDAQHNNVDRSYYVEKQEDGKAILRIGTIGTIYGGGYVGDVQGNTSVEIGTGRWISSWDADGNPIWTSKGDDGNEYTYKIKNVYYTQAECDEYNAGLTGALNSTDALSADEAVAYNTAMSASKAADDTLTAEEANAYNATLTGARTTADVNVAGSQWAWYNSSNEEVAQPVPARNAATITGNVFGGGQGEAVETGEDAFTCAKAMVGVVDDGVNHPEGGTSVVIENGTVGTLQEEKLVAGTGNVYGGGEIGRVEKNTVVTIGKEGEIAADSKFKPVIRGDVFGAGKGVATHGYSALVRGNSTVTIQGQAKIGRSVYGGGQIASVGRYTVGSDGIPTSLVSDNYGNCVVVVKDNAEIGPDDMAMAKLTGGPDDTGYIFGGGQGMIPYEGVTGDPWRIDKDKNKEYYNTANPKYSTAKEAENGYLKYIESLGLATTTDVTVSGNAFIKGSVYGGAENGYVQHDTYVKIQGGQIGNGYIQLQDNGSHIPTGQMRGVNRRYTDAEWAAGRLFVDGVEVDNSVDDDYKVTETVNEVSTTYTLYTSSLPECASWPYGRNGVYAPHDKFANTAGYNAQGGAVMASDGCTFFGNVFGGGSGYWPYAAGKWHTAAGTIGGNAHVDITGGHILTNVYGGNELSDVTGEVVINFGGTATLGVPRTVGQTIAHPVGCNLYGAGKGDPRPHFNKNTNVQNVTLNIEGGTIYGSVFGGGEDGHVLKNTAVTIGKDDHTGPTIGTFGTTGFDGNVFGGGRGFSGDAYTAGNVAGSVTLDIKGGTMLGSVYGGGRLGSVGYGLYEASETGKYGEMQEDGYGDWYKNASDEYVRDADDTFKRGYVTINITGGTIGNTNEFIIPTGNGPVSGKAFGSWTDADWTSWKNTNNVPNTTYDTSNARVVHSKGGNVYAGGKGRYYMQDNTTPVSSYTAAGVLDSPIEWTKLGSVKSTKLTISGDPWIMGDVYGGGELGTVSGTHKVLDGEGNPVKVDGKDVVTSTEIIIESGTIGTEVTGATPQKETVSLPAGYPDTENSAVKYTFGSVYGGGEGLEEHDASKNNDHGGKVSGDARVTISGSTTKVRANVFGGGEMALVGGSTYVNISDGEIGRNEVQRKTGGTSPGYVMFGGATMGNVYGAGKGKVGHFHTGQVMHNTYVNISGGKIYHNVYGGGALGSVGTFDLSTGTVPDYMPFAGIPYQWRYTDGSVINPANLDNTKTPTGTATINITGGVIGISGRDNGMVNGSSRGDVSCPPEGVKFTQEEADAYNTAHSLSSGDAGYKTTNDWKVEPMDPYDKVAWVNKSVVNIGKQGAVPTDADYLTAPIVKGAVYGGGENGHNYMNATVNIHSGTIGIAEKDPADTTKDDPWWTVGDEAKDKQYRADRGNVYGAGCGLDHYTDSNGKEHSNPRAGMVGGNTFVNIFGGHIGRSVYGAGAMASVGNITNARDTLDVAQGGTGLAKYVDETKSFALSWPYRFEFAPGTGKATINVTGGHVGTKDVDGGDVFGGARGEAGDRYVTAHLAFVNEAEVNINYPAPTAPDPDAYYEAMMPTIKEDYTTQCVTGSVSGSGEDGYVYGDTHVTLNEGLIGHSLYGAGKGKGVYTHQLLKIGKTQGSTNPNDYYDANIYSLIAGKVMGNTYVTMNRGYVGRNVYGGGNMASVGKGNYASGNDDYANDCYIGATFGYGEKTDNAPLWTPTDGFKPKELITNSNKPTSLADYFLSSGHTTVKVLGGTVGYLDKSDPTASVKNDLPYGNVFGGSAGEATANISETPRYLYSPAFYSGYVNETDVVIGNGHYRCKEAYDTYSEGDFMTFENYKELTSNQNKWEYEKLGGPKIISSVYGGGQDGHVRRDTKVTVYDGEIGMSFTTDNQTVLGGLRLTDGSDNPQWLARGNVYGGGSGISKYKYDFNYDGRTTVDDNNDGKVDDTETTPQTSKYNGNDVKEEDYSNSSGSVTRFTEVNILGGTIHRNVYGGGSMGPVGPPNLGQSYDPYSRYDTTHSADIGKQSQCTVNISSTIGSPAPNYKDEYGGEVYGACRGMTDMQEQEDSFSYAIWTLVNVKNGAWIKGNVFGGGDAGAVKKNAEVKIGE